VLNAKKAERHLGTNAKETCLLSLMLGVETLMHWESSNLDSGAFSGRRVPKYREFSA
jgi:hypothetical protein